MSAGHPVAIERAREAMQDAAAAWDATDLSKIRRCQAYILSAVDALGENECREAARNPQARQSLARLRDDAVRLRTLIDAASSFHRGLALRSGNAGALYSASGEMLVQPAAPDFSGVEA